MSLLRHLKGHTVWPECPSCGREGDGLPIVDLIALHGPDAELSAILVWCRCARCGRLGTPRVTMSWTMPASGERRE